jgi:two-component system, sensor histidine kinase PdtaS
MARAQQPAIALVQTPRTASTPQQAIALGNAYKNRAEWFTEMPQYNRDSTVFYYHKAIAVLDGTDPTLREPLAAVYTDLSDHYYRHFDIETMKKMVTKAWGLLEKIPDEIDKTKQLRYKLLRDRAFAELEEGGNPRQGLNFILKALSLYQRDNRVEVQAELLKDKGGFYARYTNGIESSVGIPFQSLKKSESLYQSLNNPIYNESIFYLCKDLVWYYNVKNKADSCDYYFAKIYTLLPLLKNPEHYNWYYSLRGNTLIRRKQYKEAKQLIVKSLNFIKTYHLEYSQVYPFNFNLLGVMATDQGHYDEAVAYLTKSKDVSTKNNSLRPEMTFFEHMHALYQQKGDYKKALDYYKKWSDSQIQYMEERSSKNLRENELQLDLIRQKQQLTEKEAQQNSFITAITITALVAVSLIILLFGLYRNFQTKQRANQQLETLNIDLAAKNTLLDKRNADNELLLKEIHHRVKNNLEVVSSLLALQSARISDPNVQEAMLSSQSRVQSMGILHQKLYQNEHLAFIEMKQYFVSLSENILDTYNETNRITVECPMPEIELDVDTAVPVGLIVNELLTNALKYAFPQGQPGRVLLSLEDVGNQMLQLRIQDNGIGKVLNGQPTGTGFGTQLIELLTRQLEGTIRQEVSNGTTISIQFKKLRPA